jgi:hypothetical protein
MVRMTAVKVSQSKSTVVCSSGPPLTCVNWPQVLVTSEDLMCFLLPTVVKAEWLECRKTQRSGPERPEGDTEVVDPFGFTWPS